MAPFLRLRWTRLQKPWCVPRGSTSYLGQVLLCLRRTWDSSIARAAAWSFGLKVAYTGLSFLATVLLTRLLSVEDYGIFSYVYAFAMLFALPVQASLPTLMVRETARAMAHDQYALVRGIWHWSGCVAVTVSLAIGLFGTLVMVGSEMLVKDTRRTFVWALLLVPLIILDGLIGGALRGLKKYVVGQLSEYLIRPLLLIGLLLALSATNGGKMTAHVAMATNVAAVIFGLAAGVWLWRRNTPEGVRKARPLLKTRAWLASAASLALIGVMDAISAKSSILILGYFKLYEQVAIYTVARQTSELASFGLYAVNVVMAPLFASLWAQNKEAEVERVFNLGTSVVLGFNVAVTLFFVFFGRWFLRFAFGSSYASSYVPLLILLVGQLANSATGFVGSLLNMTNHERVTALGTATSMSVNLILNMLLIPALGINGGAISSAVSLIVRNVFLWMAVRRILRINAFL